MIGTIIEIVDDNIPATNGRPEIKKKIATIDFQNGESAAIEFTGELRRSLIRGFKVNDNVDVEFTTNAHKNKRGKVFYNKKAKSIKRL
jgi:hypothetical protein